MAGKVLPYGKLMNRLKVPIISAWRSILKVGKEDSRRVIHALKVGLALTLVSLLYLLEPLFQGVGQNAMWAVMTVVVVLEFTAGATLCKGLNRGFGTLCAGSLAFLIEIVAERSGRVLRATFIGTTVFLIGFITTYLRFIPYIKKNYDYGVLIFLLTFNLITVSSYRIENVLNIARERFYTIAIGCAICLFMSILVLPNWSGEELHKSTVNKLEVLAKSIEACVNEYFQEDPKANEESPRDIIIGYKKVLDSKSTDETLATFASWEPRHSIHCYKFPWQRYVELATVIRRFGYTVVSLHGCLESEIQTPRSIRSLFRDPCTRVAGEVCKVLTELTDSIKNHRHCSPNVLSDHLHEALHDLNSALKSQPKLFLGSKNSQSTAKRLTDTDGEKEKNTKVSLPTMKTDISALLHQRSRKASDQLKEPAERKTLRPQLSKIVITSLQFSEALPLAAFASLLVEMVARLELVIEEVEKLANAAHFKPFPGEDKITIEVISDSKRSNSVADLPSNVPPQGAAE